MADDDKVSEFVPPSTDAYEQDLDRLAERAKQARAAHESGQQHESPATIDRAFSQSLAKGLSMAATVISPPILGWGVGRLLEEFAGMVNAATPGALIGLGLGIVAIIIRAVRESGD